MSGPFSDRFHRAESLVSAREEYRLGIATWLGGMLRRPPLAQPDETWAVIAAFVEALWWDLSDMTPDPLSPVVEGVGQVPYMHERLLASHPWGHDV